MYLFFKMNSTLVEVETYASVIVIVVAVIAILAALRCLRDVVCFPVRILMCPVRTYRWMYTEI